MMGKFTIIICSVAFFVCLSALTSCEVNQNGGGSDNRYRYILDSYEDIIFPPSGTADRWIIIRGGDSGGYSPPGNTYYVAPNGSDEQDGSREKPWATPAFGASQLQPGDMLVILGNKPGEVPILAGREDLSCALDLSGVSYLRLENLEIESDGGAWFREGIQAYDGPLNHIVLRDLYIHNVDEMGIDVADAQDLQIINCRICYCGFGSIGGPEGSQGGWRNILIDHCTLSYSGHYYQGQDQLGPYDRPDGFGIEPSAGPIEIKNTVAEHNRGDGLDSKADNTYIHECIVANNSCDGVKLWGGGSKVENTLIYGRGDGDTTATPWSAVVIGTEESGASFALVNNTIDDFVGNNYIMHVQYDTPTTPIDLTIKNTIFSSRGENAGIYLAEGVNYNIEYNLFYFPNCDYVLTVGDQDFYDGSQVGELGAGNLYGDPRFVSPAFGEVGDYHLLDNSPAIDAGTADGAPSTDLEGISRPQGAGYDIGAYER
jgi:hypothetical protein